MHHSMEQVIHPTAPPSVQEHLFQAEHFMDYADIHSILNKQQVLSCHSSKEFALIKEEKKPPAF